MRRLGSLGLVTGMAGMVAIVVAVGAALAADARVAVVNNAYEPRQVTINAGDSVTWDFEGTAPHSVTADDGSFDSHPQCSTSNIVGCSSPASPPFERTFAGAGTFSYYCKIHGSPGGGGMAGVVVVNAAGGGAAPTTAAPTTAAPTTTAGSATRQTTTTAAAATSTSVDDTSTTTSSSTSTSSSTTVELAADAASDDDGASVGWIVLGALLAAIAAGGAGFAGYQLIQSRRAGAG